MKKILTGFLTALITIAIITSTTLTVSATNNREKIFVVSTKVVVIKHHICLLKSKKASTCEEDGYVKYKCLFCRYQKTFTYDATGHSEVADKPMEPTCTEDGYTAGSHCSKCNTILKNPTVITATGHSISENIKKASPTESGYIESLCSVCEYNDKRSISQPTEITLKAPSFEYTGKEISPDIVIYDKNGDIIDNNNYMLNYTNNIYVGTATVTATFVGKYYEGEMNTTFSIKSAHPTWSISLRNARPKGFKVTFPVSPTINKYEIQYSLSSTFQKSDKSTKTIVKTITTDTEKNYSFTVTGLQPSKTYYVRVRFQSPTGVYGNWSQKTIKINNY